MISVRINEAKVVALLRGGAWIEMINLTTSVIVGSVALLRGGAWIEIAENKVSTTLVAVALLRGGAWIEIGSRRSLHG